MYKLLFFILIIAGLGYFVYRDGLIEKFQESITLKHMVQLTSSAFENNGVIPSVYTCDGVGINPPLTISNVPGTAQSMALIVEDPDAPGMTYTHWIFYNIPANTTTIPENDILTSQVQLAASSGKVGYEPPCPPAGTHRYIFTLYVLDATLTLSDTATKVDLLQQMQNHIIDKTQLIGRYTRSAN